MGYDVVVYRSSTVAVSSGYAVADKPEAEFTGPMWCLGLRVKLADGVEAITTVTHGFVHLPGHGVVVRVANWFSKAKEALLRFRTPEKTEGILAHVKINRAVGNSALGKDVWLALNNIKVSSIGISRDKGVHISLS